MVNSIKKRVKMIIFESDKNLWKANCMLYRSLGIYHRNVIYKRLNVWWRFVAKTPGAFRSVSCVVALLCGSQPNGYGANCGSQRRSQISGDFTVETMEHIIFECEGL